MSHCRSLALAPATRAPQLTRLRGSRSSLTCTASLSSSAASGKETKGPLHGVKVLEVGQFVAGPYASTVLAYYGAEVVKVEPPGLGDQVRKFRDVDETGTSWWWYSIGRNKKSIALDMRVEKGQKIVRDMATTWADVVVENFKPGTMEKWNLGAESLRKLNPKLIYTCVSGYGRTGPYASRPGFASACEAMGGFRYVNGFPDGPSVRPNLSMGDTLAGINGAMGTMMALYARDGGRLGKDMGGQIVDTALYESVFGVMEGVLCDYSGAGIVRQPSGSTVTGIVPTNTYPTKDGKKVVIGANSDQLFKRLMLQMGRPDMAEDPQYKDNQDRVRNQAVLDATIGAWTSTLTSTEVLERVGKADVPNGLIYSIVDIVEDPQYQARGQLEKVQIPTKTPGKTRDLLVPAIGPKLDVTPGGSKWCGPKIGEHTDEILKSVLNLTQAQIDDLRKSKVIG